MQKGRYSHRVSAFSRFVVVSTDTSNWSLTLWNKVASHAPQLISRVDSRSNGAIGNDFHWQAIVGANFSLAL